MRATSIFTAALLSVLTVSTALADPLPVVAVNREIGLSMAGIFDNLVGGYGDQYQTTGGRWYGPYRSASQSRSRRIGWVPGFQVDASTMVSLGRIENLYASALFRLGSGTRNDKYARRYSSAYGGDAWQSNGGESANSTYSRGEIGKGFLFLHDKALITPFVQGGYDSYGYDSFGGQNAFFVGLGVNADYALTDRLVLRGRFGWAEILDTQTYRVKGAATRPRWEGSLGADYRMTRHWHLTAGGDYAYTSYGHDKDQYRYQSVSEGQVAGRWTSSGIQNGLTLRAGLAYAY
ncbi:hypothetical protein C0V97_03375 [Asaia sp. W19]|uniref:hypothetical protein n=1 Tax=unclassified Asaia TaxID=2685023 RepID=UPI000F8EF839|nr:hypothetical protein [Asaia sp. W19]RUT27258.1 hypothetical protein C0V97_03375 [Asaia sp. W19]